MKDASIIPAGDNITPNLQLQFTTARATEYRRRTRKGKKRNKGTVEKPTPISERPRDRFFSTVENLQQSRP